MVPPTRSNSLISNSTNKDRQKIARRSARDSKTDSFTANPTGTRIRPNHKANNVLDGQYPPPTRAHYNCKIAQDRGDLAPLTK